MRVLPLLVLSACAATPVHPLAKEASDRCSFYVQQGSLERAEEAGRLAIEYSPRFHEPYNCLGLVFYRGGKPELARQNWRRAISLNNDFVEAYNNFGSFLHEQRDYSLAVRQFEQALAIDPGFVPARVNLAKSLVQLQKIGEARKHLIRCTELDDNAEDCWYGLGSVASAQGFGEEAESFFVKQASVAPQSASAWLNVCRARIALQKCREAADACSQSIHLDPGRLEAHESLTQAVRCQQK